MTRVLQLLAFRRLFAAYTLNELAWAIGSIALPLLVYRQTGSALGAMGFYLCSQGLPALVAPWLVGRIAHLPIGRLLLSLYAVEACIYAGLAVLAGHFRLAPVLVVVVIDGVIALVARSLARAASVAATAPAGLLREGNSLLNVSFSVCYVTGSALGGVVVAAGGLSIALVVCASVFAVIALSFVGISIAAPAEPGAPPERRLRSALGYVRRRPGVGALLVLQGVAVVFFTVATPVMIVFADHTLHKGAGGYAALLSAWGAGAVGGSLLLVRLRNSRSHRLLALGAGALGTGFVAIALSRSIVPAVAAAALSGLGNGIESVAARTALQEQLEPRWVTAVSGLSESIQQATPVLGIVLGGVLTAVAGARGALWFGGLGSLVVALLFGSVLRRLIQPLPQGAPGEPVLAGEAGSPPPAPGAPAPLSGG